MGTRREPRVPATLPVRIFGSDANGRPFSENVQTVDISRYGAKLGGLKAVLMAGEVVGMSHGASKGRFVVQWAGQPETSQAGQIGLLNNSPDKWTWETPLPPAYIDNYAGGARAAGDRRKYVRMKSANSVQVLPEGDSAPIWGKTVDLSEGGCFVDMPIPLELDTRIKITLWINDRKLWSKAKIISKRPGFGNGVQFTDMSMADTQVLNTFLKSLRESRQTAAGTP